MATFLKIFYTANNKTFNKASTSLLQFSFHTLQRRFSINSLEGDYQRSAFIKSCPLCAKFTCTVPPHHESHTKSSFLITVHIFTYLTLSCILCLMCCELFTLSTSLYLQFSYLQFETGAVVAQSVQCLTTDWMTGVWSPAEAINFSSSLFPDQLWGLPSLPSNVYWGSFPLSQEVKHSQGMTLTTHPHLVPRSRMTRKTPLSLATCMA
jgi:hypothetical protein